VHILITSGPTRQYLDAVRYLTNASSGRMGKALAEAALALARLEMAGWLVSTGGWFEREPGGAR